MGARKIGVASLPPIGCFPASITLYGPSGSSDCVERLNNDAQVFNKKLEIAAKALKRKLSGLTLVVLDAYHTILDLIKNPSDNGA